MTPETFEGTPCRAAGHTTRYVSTGVCVACRRAQSTIWWKLNKDRKRDYAKRYRELHKDSVAAYQEKWRKNNPERMKQRLARMHGRSVVADTKAREEFDGKCAICGTTKPNRKGWCVDHVHDGSGDVRGILCGACNVGIGYLKDSAELLAKALEYISQPPRYPADGKHKFKS